MKKKDLNVNYRLGMPSNEPWQKEVSESIFPRQNSTDPFTAVLAREPSKRQTPHVKVNECDH